MSQDPVHLSKNRAWLEIVRYTRSPGVSSFPFYLLRLIPLLFRRKKKKMLHAVFYESNSKSTSDTPSSKSSLLFAHRGVSRCLYAFVITRDKYTLFRFQIETAFMYFHLFLATAKCFHMENTNNATPIHLFVYWTVFFIKLKNNFANSLNVGQIFFIFINIRCAFKIEKRFVIYITAWRIFS